MTSNRGAVSSFLVLTFATLFALAGPASGQVSFNFAGSGSASLCSSVTMTTRFENTGATLSGLIITQRLPSAAYLYVTNSTTITLPDSSVLTGALANPVLVNSTTLVWNFSSVATSSTVSHLLITEVFYDSTNAAPEEEHEWIELYNPTASAIGLTNWSIADTVPGSSDTLPTFVMQPGELVIIAARTNVFFSHYPGYTGQVFEVTDGTLGSGLNNYADGIILRNAALVAQDAVSYGGSTVAFSPAANLVPVNSSLERNPANEDNNNRSDWSAQPVPNPGSASFQSGIQNGGVITIVNQLEISCAAVGGLVAATANYQQPAGGPGTFSATALSFLDVLIGDLVITKTPTVTNAGVGDLVVWNVRISNEGFGDIKNVRVTDNLGAGLAFQGFGVNPTNSFPYGSSVTWDSSVVPAFTNIAPTTSVSLVVTAIVTGCSNLFNRADATWGCRSMQAVTNQTCEDTVIEGETAGAAILFIDRRPSLAGNLSAGATPLNPTSVVSIAYCSGGTVTLHATNTASGPAAGTAFNVVYTPQLPAGYTITPTNAQGKVPLGNLAPGASTSVTVTIQAGGSCPLNTDIQAVYFLAESQDGCGNTYFNPFLSTKVQLGQFPAASVVKIMPESVPGTATSIPVTVLFSYTNFQNTSVTVIDDYPSETNISPPA
jgi:uncharacterized repeat protein (TIGR01451 family)